MEIELADVSVDASVWDVKRAIGHILHSDDFFNPTDPKDRPVNFQVKLNPGHGGVQNNGTGKLILGSRKIGDKFLKWLHGDGNEVRINTRKMRFFRSKSKPAQGLALTLEKTPYLDPDIEEEREQKLEKLDVGLHVDIVQFGVFYRRKGSPKSVPRAFSTELEISHEDKGAGLLWFEYDHKLIRVQMGDKMTEEIALNIVISFANIRKIAIGLDWGKPFLCFDLLTPPILQKERFNRELTENWGDKRKFRQRLSSLNEAHAVVAPYAHQLRMVLHEEKDIVAFAELCTVAGLQPPVRANVEASSRGFFRPKPLHTVELWVRKFSWPVAFQIEALLRNALVNTDDLLTELYKPINDLCQQHPTAAADALRHFTEALRSRDSFESPLECFHRVKPRGLELTSTTPSDGQFLCHHVTFTPTRMILEGPYVSQSNRVLRLYQRFQDNFLRVDFRDEDRLQYRWARDVDGTSLLFDRVGGVLKNGFELAGRHFEFLAYSSSALREHAVWFMHPFEHPEKGPMTAQRIRDSLGDFSGIIRQPSKYAARLAQAFTATDPSVKIRREQWDEMPDMGDKPYLYTDGVGTISVELGDMIWAALCKDKPDLMRRAVKPSAYQIRFLGYKGVVAIDEQLQGIKMRLRESMNKFKVHEEELAEIEIARAFHYPGTSYLNRPLIMILEDLGVEKKSFIELQELAKEDIFTAHDSMEKTIKLMKAHSLGKSYGLSFIIEWFRKLGLGFKHEKNVRALQDPFLDRLIHYAKNHVLRDIKHGARIPIPESYLLVGVADEGPAYEAAGMENVFSLTKGQIYACIQDSPDSEPIYLKGSVTISRSPAVHPGDIQRVFAIGAPPPDKICFFRNLKNVVVLPSTGGRSLASCLGGGDLDGDLYSVIKYGPLLPTDHADPASYESVGTHTIDHDSTVEDICDFVVQYLDSDLLGLLSDRHLIIADQSKDGVRDPKCLELAALCSQAVDYPKNGVPVDIHHSPRLLIPYKPDWHQAEDAAPRTTDYYESSRALGDLFRNIAIVDPTTRSPTAAPINGAVKPKVKPLSDVISSALKPYIQMHLHRFRNEESDVGEMTKLFQRYVDELRYICMTHALSDAPDVRLMEEEVAVGTIIAKCSQTRWRTDRTFRMRLHSAMLTRDVDNQLFKQTETPAPGELRYGLSQAWLAWDFSMRNKTVFGANSFGLIALRNIFNILDLVGSVVEAEE